MTQSVGQILGKRSVMKRLPRPPITEDPLMREARKARLWKFSYPVATVVVPDVVTDGTIVQQTTLVLREPIASDYHGYELMPAAVAQLLRNREHPLRPARWYPQDDDRYVVFTVDGYAVLVIASTGQVVYGRRPDEV